MEVDTLKAPYSDCPVAYVPPKWGDGKLPTDIWQIRSWWCWMVSPFIDEDLM